MKKRIEKKKKLVDVRHLFFSSFFFFLSISTEFLVRSLSFFVIQFCSGTTVYASLPMLDKRVALMLHEFYFFSWLVQQCVIAVALMA